jgi:hypothetical protein
MAKDKKKDKDGKKTKKAAAVSAVAAPATASKKVGKKLKAASQNPLVADVIAAALVATAAALKDSNRARQLAAEGGEELDRLAKGTADRGNALWLMALEVGRRAVDELAKPKSKSPASKKSTAK